MRKDVWLSSILTGLIVFVAVQFVPSSVGGIQYELIALIGAASAFVSIVIVRKLFHA